MTSDYSYKVWDVSLVFLALTLQYLIPFHLFLFVFLGSPPPPSGALWFQPPSLSLSPCCRLVLHSPTLSCQPPALPPQTASFFSPDLILTGLVELLLEPEHSLKSTPAGAVR